MNQSSILGARTQGLLAAMLLAGGFVGSADAAVIVYQGAGGLGGFNTAAGSPAIAINFDSIAAGTNIAGNTISGVTFSSPEGNSLAVVTAASTATPAGFTLVTNALTNVLPATSGANVLSPGGSSLVPGPDLAQKDSLQLDFSIGQRGVGIDVLFQSADCCSFLNYFVFDTALNQIATGEVSGLGGGGGDPAASRFIGFYSNDATLIGRIRFADLDDNSEYPDSNFGYDTLRLTATPVVTEVPEPGTLALLALGLAGLGLGRRRTPRLQS
jgi:hypothetical protein